jgi:hypothetical protein
MQCAIRDESSDGFVSRVGWMGMGTKILQARW